MVECGESDKLVKISGEVDKTDTYKWLTSVTYSLFQIFIL